VLHIISPAQRAALSSAPLATTSPRKRGALLELGLTPRNIRRRLNGKRRHHRSNEGPGPKKFVDGQ
jgi:hypothetical protein